MVLLGVRSDAIDEQYLVLIYYRYIVDIGDVLLYLQVCISVWRAGEECGWWLVRYEYSAVSGAASVIQCWARQPPGGGA